ncbi:hypothetical protein K491DRAFT_574632, partial [Lophiostoma macrostomum CBS 122681]
IPTELRLQIYDYCLADASTYTISAAPLTVFGCRIKDKSRRRHIPGLPDDYCPIVRSCYDAKLLSISEPPTLSLEDSPSMMTRSSGVDVLPYPAPLALMQTCRLVNQELTDYVVYQKDVKKTSSESRCASASGGLSLYVTYPYGVLVLKELCPFLLCHAKNVYLSGYYTPPPRKLEETSQRSRREGACERPRLRLDPPRTTHIKFRTSLPAHPWETMQETQTAMRSLIRTLLGRTSPPKFQMLEARFYYSGDDTYSSVWSDERGPVPQVFENTCGGKIDMEVHRGSWGNGASFTVMPDKRRRTLSTLW